MSDAAILLLVIGVLLMWATWPYAKVFVLEVFARLKIAFASVQVLTFTAPRPDAKAAVFTFWGVSLGDNFFGKVTRQEAKIAPPEPVESRIVSV